MHCVSHGVECIERPQKKPRLETQQDVKRGGVEFEDDYGGWDRDDKMSTTPSDSTGNLAAVISYFVCDCGC